MTVSSTQSRTDFAGDGTSTSFTIPFFFIADNDIEARRTSTDGAETVWVDGTEYTLSGKGVASGGTLTLKSTDFVPATGEKLTIRRLEQFTQPSDFAVAGALPSETIEEGYDRLTMLIQQLAEEGNRTMKAPAGESAAMGNLPSTGDRADAIMGWDATGQPKAFAGSVSTADVSITTFMKTLLDDGGSTEASDTLDFLARSVDQSYSKQKYFAATALSESTTIAWDAAANQVAILQLTTSTFSGGAKTLQNPTNQKDGATYILIVKQSTRGSTAGAVEFTTGYHFADKLQPVLTTDANAKDIFSFVSESTKMLGVGQFNFGTTV